MKEKKDEKEKVFGQEDCNKRELADDGQKKKKKKSQDEYES